MDWTVFASIVAVGLVACIISCYLNGAKLLQLEEAIKTLEDRLRNTAAAPPYFDKYATERYVVETSARNTEDLHLLLEHLGLEWFNEDRKLVPRKPPES